MYAQVPGSAVCSGIPNTTCRSQGLAQHSAPPVHRLQALVVLPTRDLAQQVADVMAPLCAATGLRLALAAAKHSLAVEAESISGCASFSSSISHPISLGLLAQRPSGVASGCASPYTGADVLVATPGRLMAHLTATPGCDLTALRFLVRAWDGAALGTAMCVHAPNIVHFNYLFQFLE